MPSKSRSVVLQRRLVTSVVQWAIVCWSFVLCLKTGYELLLRAWYEASGPITADTSIYLAVGRGILNGLLPYRDLFETKPPGIFLLSALSLRLFDSAALGSMLEAYIVLTFPILVLLAARPIARHWTPAIRRTVEVLSFVFGALLSLYLAERAGEYQVESFGAYFATLAIVIIATEKRPSALRTGALSGMMLCAIGMKEPFLLTIVASALLLTAERPRALWHSLVFPLLIATVVGVVALLLLGYLRPFLSIYLPEILGKHISYMGSPLRRGLDWQIIVSDLHDFDPYLSATLWMVLILALSGLLKPRWSSLRVAAAAALALYLSFLAVGVGGDYFNHHYVFAVPTYVALFLCALRALTLWHPSRAATAFGLLATVMSLALLQLPVMLYDVRLSILRDQVTRARSAARTIDAILDDCGDARYFYIGGNGTQPFAYTHHSPMGPVFFEDTRLFDEDDGFFNEAFFRELSQARFVVFESFDLERLESKMEEGLSAFTDTPWRCAENVPIPDGFTLFYRLPPTTSEGLRSMPSGGS